MFIYGMAIYIYIYTANSSAHRIAEIAIQIIINSYLHVLCKERESNSPMH